MVSSPAVGSGLDLVAGLFDLIGDIGETWRVVAKYLNLGGSQLPDLWQGD